MQQWFFFGLRNEFVNVQGIKKRSSQNIQVKKQQKKQKGHTELITVQWPRAIKPKSQDNWWCH